MTLRKWMFISVVCGMLAGCGGPWSSGDRVLVSKCNYDLGITHPHRYDVVVFKFPGRRPDEGPVEKNTPKNYIKRLLGLPGELLAIFFGRVYRWAPGPDDEPPFEDNKDPEINPNELFRERFLHTDAAGTRHWFEEGSDEKTGQPRTFEILRKPPPVLLAMRRIVYDNDHQARDLKGKLDRWAPAGKTVWKADKDTGFAHEGQETGEVDWLRYQHLLRPNGVIAGDIKEKPKLITDTMDYNSFQTRTVPRGGALDRDFVTNNMPENQHWVGDLMLECNVDVAEAKGEFWLELSKGIYRFRARFDLASGECTLYQVHDGKSEEIGTKPTKLKGRGSYLLRMANIDARVTVWVDRELPFGDGQEYDPPEIRGPKDKGLTWEQLSKRRGPTENDLQPASIGSKGASVKIAHVRLWRDTYYTTSPQGGDYHLDDREVLAEPSRWGPIQQSRFSILYVQPGHYLCLGDNSQASSDSRDWGLVPQRLMLGRALAVYFPIERMGPIR